MDIRIAELVALIDHTLLKPEATAAEVQRLCEEAQRYGFYSVCVSPHFASVARESLGQSPVKISVVTGFPSGAHETAVKAYEAARAVEQGADEIDMVMNIGAAKAGDWRRTGVDIAAVVKSAKGRPVKVIIETCLLSDEEKIAACKICRDAGASFVKTSTGFNQGGATVADVRLLQAVTGAYLEVKASGGIRDYKTACKMVEAGANRLGASASVNIIRPSRSLSRASDGGFEDQLNHFPEADLPLFGAEPLP